MLFREENLTSGFPQQQQPRKWLHCAGARESISVETQIRNLSDLHGYGIRNKAFHQETSDLSATDFSSSEGFINGGILYVFPVYGTARMGQEFAAQPKMN